MGDNLAKDPMFGFTASPRKSQRLMSKRTRDPKAQETKPNTATTSAAQAVKSANTRNQRKRGVTSETSRMPGTHETKCKAARMPKTSGTKSATTRKPRKRKVTSVARFEGFTLDGQLTPCQCRPAPRLLFSQDISRPRSHSVNIFPLSGDHIVFAGDPDLEDIFKEMTAAGQPAGGQPAPGFPNPPPPPEVRI